MIVSELIELLQTFNPDSVVKVNVDEPDDNINYPYERNVHSVSELDDYTVVIE